MKIYTCILAVAVGAAACGGGRADRDHDSTVGTSGRDDGSRQVTLAGCLQKGDGSDYILTQVNAPAGAVGTTGTPSDARKDSEQPSAVGQQQMRAAAHSYRLSGDDDQMRDLVGHQVRVQGTLKDKADLSRDKAGTADKPSDIDEGDLASINVASIQSTGPACGAERK